MLERVVNNLQAYEKWARGCSFPVLHNVLYGGGAFAVVNVPGEIPGKDLKWWELKLIAHGSLDIIVRMVYEERCEAGERLPPPADPG